MILSIKTNNNVIAILVYIYHTQKNLIVTRSHKYPPKNNLIAQKKSAIHILINISYPNKKNHHTKFPHRYYTSLHTKNKTREEEDFKLFTWEITMRIKNHINIQITHLLAQQFLQHTKNLVNN